MKRGDSGSKGETGCISDERVWLLHRTKTPIPQATSSAPLDWTLHCQTLQMNTIPLFSRNKPVTGKHHLYRHTACHALGTRGVMLCWPSSHSISPLETLTSAGCLVHSGYRSYQPASIKVYPRAASDRLKSTIIYYPRNTLSF